MQKSILVTGGAGYVGAPVVEELLAQGHSVRVLDSLVHGAAPWLLPWWRTGRFDFCRADVRDAAARRDALTGVDAVVHLAAIVGDPACARQPELAREVNLDATRGLVRDAQAAQVERLVFASTCSNYGRAADDALVSEDVDLRPVSLYAETKVAAELDILAVGGSNGLATCCLRFATVYGISPRMRFDLTVNEFTRDASVTGELVIYGEQFWRPYIHVRDAARAIRIAVEAPRDVVAGEVFNVGSTEENYRKADIVELVRERLPQTHVERVERDEDPRDYRVSFEKVKGVLGFTPERRVGDGIDEILDLLRSGLIEDPYLASYRN